MFVIKYKKIFIGISVLFVTLSIAAVIVFGLKLGIDFKGGSSLELSYNTTRPEITEIKDSLINSGFGDASIQPAGEKGIVIKSRDLTEAERATIVSLSSLDGKYQVEQKSFTTIGPSVGSELKKKAIASIILVLFRLYLLGNLSCIRYLR